MTNLDELLSGEASDGEDKDLPFAALNKKHEEYNREYRDLLSAMVLGGSSLLHNDEHMAKLLPQHAREIDAIYAKRRDRAVYSNYAGEILGYLFSMMSSDPLLVRLPEEKGEGEDDKVGSAGSAVESSAKAGSESGELPLWIRKMLKNCSYSWRNQQTLSDFILHQVREMTITGFAWTLVDLPKVKQDFISLAEQESSNALQPYLVALPTNTVLDWGEDDYGELSWAVHHTCKKFRENPADSKCSVAYTFNVYSTNPDGSCTYKKYQVVLPDGKVPGPRTKVPLVETTTLPILPIRRTVCPKGLWLMDAVYSLAAESFRKESNLAWFEAQSLAQELYEYIAPTEDDTGVLIDDDGERKRNEALTSARGAGYIQIRGHKDRAEYLAPHSDIYKYALESKRNVKDEIHRLLYVISLSIEQNSSALRRSAISKTQDKIAEEVILASIATVAMRLVKEILVVSAIIRGETKLDFIRELKISGYENFTADSDGAIIESAIKASMLQLPSKTYHVHQSVRVARAALGVEVDQETIEQIREELEEAYEVMYAHPDIAMGLMPTGAEPTRDYGSLGTVKKVPGPGEKPSKHQLEKAAEDDREKQDYAHTLDPSIAQSYKKPWHKK